MILITILREAGARPMMTSGRSSPIESTAKMPGILPKARVLRLPLLIRVLTIIIVISLRIFGLMKVRFLTTESMMIAIVILMTLEAGIITIIITILWITTVTVRMLPALSRRY